MIKFILRIKVAIDIYRAVSRIGRSQPFLHWVAVGYKDEKEKEIIIGNLDNALKLSSKQVIEKNKKGKSK